jgi:hypothetical protein
MRDSSHRLAASVNYTQSVMCYPPHVKDVNCFGCKVKSDIFSLYLPCLLPLLAPQIQMSPSTFPSLLSTAASLTVLTLIQNLLSASPTNLLFYQHHQSCQPTTVLRDLPTFCCAFRTSLQTRDSMLYGIHNRTTNKMLVTAIFYTLLRCVGS